MKINIELNNIKEIEELRVFLNLFNEHFNKEKTLKADVLDLKIKDCELSARSLNCLLREDIRTVGDLMKRNKSSLRRVPELGKKSLIEIEEMLDRVGDLRLDP